MTLVSQSAENNLEHSAGKSLPPTALQQKFKLMELQAKPTTATVDSIMPEIDAISVGYRTPNCADRQKHIANDIGVIKRAKSDNRAGSMPLPHSNIAAPHKAKNGLINGILRNLRVNEIALVFWIVFAVTPDEFVFEPLSYVKLSNVKNGSSTSNIGGIKTERPQKNAALLAEVCVSTIA